MKISNRTLGYLSFLALICLFASVAYGMYAAHQDVDYTATVDFDELGTLQPEDVVVVRGYRVGSIESATWLGDRSRVIIKFDKPIVIREGTQFNNVNYALMGQRRLEIIPSKTGKVLPEDFVHQGHFEPGIAEALRLMEDVNRQITAVREMVLLIVNGDSVHASVKQKYEEIVGSIEFLLESADKTLNSVKPQLNDVFAQVENASNTLMGIATGADTTIRAATTAINEKIASAQNVVTTLSGSVSKINQVVDELENNPTLQKLTTSQEAIEKLNEILSKTNALIAAIDTKGVKMFDENGNQVKLFTWKNLNLIGKTAREKAKIRAEKGESLPE